MDKLNETVKKTMILQRDYFHTGETLDVNFRIRQLKRLYSAIKEHESEIADAINKDFKKPYFESYATEIGLVLIEIRHMLRHLKHWSRPQTVRTPLSQFKAKSRIYYEPYGVTLIIAPWNYPFMLTMAPVIGSLAAGNTVIIKPANYSENTSLAIKNIMNSIFPEKYISVFTGGREVNSALLEESYDYIFFTGSPDLGKTVMEKASKNLTPVTLELGGKSPCIITDRAKIKLAAKRVAWGKFINAGQTCVAPDYALVHESVKESFLVELKKSISELYGQNPEESPDFARIINAKHHQRLKNLIKNEKIVCGGNFTDEDLYIAPTVLDSVSPEAPVMGEEIFGPILPVLTYNNIDDLITFVRERPRPLACYIFTESKKEQNDLRRALSFGGGCINDVIVHLSNPELPFGGIGNSGMGRYHGKHNFLTFSHLKSIMNKSTSIDIPTRYAPYSDKKLKLVKKLMK